MVVRELQDEIVTVVFSELLRAQKEHGETFNSMPEAFSVIWEEIEEAKEEMQRVIQILSRRSKNNPCLVGEPGVGKTAIAMCVKAQRGGATWSKGKIG